MTGVLLAVGGVVDRADKDGLSRLEFASSVSDWAAKFSNMGWEWRAGYGVGQSLALGISGELRRLASGSCWYSSEDAIDGDGRGGHCDCCCHVARGVKRRQEASRGVKASGRCWGGWVRRS